MKKDTPLEKILLRYTGAAATVIGAHTAQGQAQYDTYGSRYRA
ncbi:MAG: hypothetical protein U5L96_04395 [Owenweeksia sp.]|nr:hypothetical protein [Owenweeksia sp.]